jgi:S1-C subfamily serine protease
MKTSVRIAASAAAGLALLITGCVERLHVEELSVAERTAVANVGIYDHLPPKTYESVAPVEATSCQTTRFEPAPSHAEALNLLRLKTARLGGEGIMQLLCSARGVTFVPNCMRSVTCVGTAIKHRPQMFASTLEAKSGSGFFINAQGDLVTNAHVTNGCTKVTVKSGDVTGDGDVVYQDRRTDLALVRTRRPSPSFVRLRIAPPVQLAETVVTAGYPLADVLSKQIHITDGAVSALAGGFDNTAWLQFTAPIQPGNSGGPLVDLSGNLVGVNSNSLNPELFNAQNVNFAVKTSTVITFLDTTRTQYHTATSDVLLAKTEVAAKTAVATVKLICEPSPAPSS